MATVATTRAATRRRHSTTALAENIYRNERAQLLAIARRNSASAEDAEEALQDAFALFLRYFNSADPAPPIAWITITLKRQCWAIYRRRRTVANHRGGISEAIPDASRRPDEAAEAAETLNVFRNRLQTPSPAQRRALGLNALGYSYQEIVLICGWSYTKVNRLIAEGHQALRPDA